MADRPLVALLYPGDRAMRDRSDPAESRFAALFEAFEQSDVRAVPAVYNEDFADEVEEQLRTGDVKAVLVWCNPIHEGRRRGRLDAMLRRLADSGMLVSAHPEAILKLGTKDVLFESRDLPFGSDVHRIDTLDQLKESLPERLRAGARVLKQHRGHSGIGIWRVELADGSQPFSPSSLLKVRHAQRGSEEECISLSTLVERLAPYFEPDNGGHLIDQAWQPDLVNGMVRAYLVEDRVAGFGHQAVNALFPAPSGQAAVPAGPRLYHGADLPQFQDLKRRLEREWVHKLRSRVGLAQERLPLLWDCDFIIGGSTEQYVLCEINVSSVAPFPPSAIAPLVAAVRSRLLHAERP